MDKSYENILTFQLSFLPNFVFVLCYITPADSPYYDKAVFGKLHSILVQNHGRDIMMFGDFNARIEARALEDRRKALAYNVSEDETFNANGRKLIQMCKDNNLAIINNLCYGDKVFNSKLSYRKGKKWISELDYCISTLNTLQYVEKFEMLQNAANGMNFPSDHAMLSVTLDVTSATRCDLTNLKLRARDLGRSVYDEDLETIQSSINIANVDAVKLERVLEANPPPNLDDIDQAVADFYTKSNTLMKSCKKPRTTATTDNMNTNRWKKIIQKNDSRMIWKAIGWNGDVIHEDEGIQPSENEFKAHFEKLLNDERNTNDEHSEINEVTIPILDDPIELIEVEKAISSGKQNKAYIGVAPGFLKLLPYNWIMFLVMLLNNVFFNLYPKKWCLSKLIVIFKKGCRLLCGNYRGISITDTLAKLYDKIIANRLLLWMNIDKNQAGGLENRGCTEQILALRLLIDYAKCRKRKLFICFIDFAKAYDTISRPMLFQVLREAGCGFVMLSAIRAMYESTKHVFKSCVINAKRGVKQGGSSSGLLFVIYMDCLTKLIRDAHPQNDGFLMSIHSLMLMDDTAILASTRKVMKKRIEGLIEFCKKYEMIINEGKTKLMVINGKREDRMEIITSNGIVIKHTETYVYLGSPISESGSMKKDLDLHAAQNFKHLNKFILFCVKNDEMPYEYKKNVFEAVLTSRLMYGCETWLCDNVIQIETMYMSAIKALLNVRQQTRNDVCLVEGGFNSVKKIINDRRSKLLEKKLTDEDEPLTKVFMMCRNANTKGYALLAKTNEMKLANTLEAIKTEINHDTNSSKLHTYKRINPILAVHEAYHPRNNVMIPDYKRSAFTKFRTGSHSLNVERGRWARVEPTMRFCRCKRNKIEDEEHVVFECELTNDLRRKYRVVGYTSLNEMFAKHPLEDVISFVYEVMKRFK